MELLAVLLKNPEVVFALTSGQASNLSNEETVKLLDMMKANGLSSSSGSLSVLGRKGKAEEKVEVSLPSPTPSSNPVTSCWKPDLAKNPFSRQMTNNHEMHSVPRIAAAASVCSQENIPASSLVQQRILPSRSTVVAEHSASALQLARQTLTAAVRSQAQPQILPTALVPSQQSGNVAQTVQQLSLLQAALGVHEQQRLATVASVSNLSSHSYASHMQLTASELELKTNTASVSSLPMRTNLLSAAAPAMQVEATGIVKPSALPIIGGKPARPGGLPLAPTPMQPSYSPEPPVVSHLWRPRQAMDQIPHYQNNLNQNNYNSFAGGHMRAPMQPGTWERYDLADEPDFESWSPDNNPMRSHSYNTNGWNFQESNPGYGCRSER